MLTAAELYQRAVDHGNAGRHAIARRTLANAAARHPGPDLAARIEGTLAYLDAETGDPDAALARCAEAAARPGLGQHTRAVLTSQLGLIELRRGDIGAAIPHLTAAAQRLDDDPARLGRVLLNRGLAHLELGDIPAAERDSAAAADAFDRVGDRVERAKAQHNQGYAALIRGDLVEALLLMDAAREVLATLSPVTLAVCDLDRAEVLRAAGMTTDAARLIASAAGAFGARRLRQMQADAEYTLAGTLLDLDPGTAAVVARRAAGRYRARGNESGALRADACRITAVVTAGSTSSVLASETARVGEALAERHLDVEAVGLQLQGARLATRSGRRDEARGILNRVGDRAGGSSIGTRMLAREVGVELAAADDDRASLLEQAREGLDDLAEWQATFGSVDLQSATSARGRRLALAAIGAAARSGDPALAFEWSERTRSLASRIVPVRPPDDPLAAVELTELRNLRMTDADPDHQAELVRSVRRRRWASAGSRAVLGVERLDRVQRELAASDAVLVSVLRANGRLSAVIAGPADAELVDLGPSDVVDAHLGGLLADLDMAAADLPPAIADVVDASLTRRLEELDAALLDPVAARLGDRVVLCVPAALAGVPWGALPSLRGRAITLPTTVSRWVAQRGTPLRAGSAGFVSAPGIARGDAEVAAAAAAWGSVDILRAEQTACAAVADLASRVGVLHISAHGRHAADNPLFSGLELADGPWFGYDVERLAEVPDVVVLSSCEVGRSASEWGRESLGMAQSWLHAGVRAVIASPSSVGDDAATELLGRVHQAMAAGAAPSDALAAAGRAGGSRFTFQVYGAGW